MHAYSMEVGAELSSISIGPGLVEISLTIKNLVKTLRTSAPLVISELTVLNLSPGERVRLLYTDADAWTLRRYSGISGVEKFLRPEE